MEHKLLDRCIPVNEETLAHIYSLIQDVFKKNDFKISPLGSYLKKNQGELYNDLDIAIEYPWEDKDKVKQLLIDNFQFQILQGHENDKLHVMNIGFKVSENNYLQVDFMFVDSLKWAQFAYHSPDFKNGESKYKGMYASILLQSVIRNIPIKEEYDENGNLINYTYLSLSQKDGLHRKSKTFIGKKGNLVKTPRTIEDKILSNDPEYILMLLFNFGSFKNYAIPDRELYSIVWSFEKLLDYLPKLEGIYFDNSFTKKYLERVKNDFLTDWQFQMKTSDELKKEFEDLFNDKINNL